MTSQQIKAASAAGNSNWEVLQMVVDAGREYPDAEFAVAQALKLDKEEIAEMRDGYDNNC